MSLHMAQYRLLTIFSHLCRVQKNVRSVYPSCIMFFFLFKILQCIKMIAIMIQIANWLYVLYANLQTLIESTLE